MEESRLYHKVESAQAFLWDALERGGISPDVGADPYRSGFIGVEWSVTTTTNYNKLRAGLDELSNGGGMFSFLMSNEAAEAAGQIDGALGKELGKDVELVLSR